MLLFCQLFFRIARTIFSPVLPSAGPYAKCNGCPTPTLVQRRINDFPTARRVRIAIGGTIFSKCVYEFYFFFIQTVLTPMTCAYCCIRKGGKNTTTQNVYTYIRMIYLCEYTGKNLFRTRVENGVDGGSGGPNAKKISVSGALNILHFFSEFSLFVEKKYIWRV